MTLPVLPVWFETCSLFWGQLQTVIAVCCSQVRPDSISFLFQALNIVLQIGKQRAGLEDRKGHPSFFLIDLQVGNYPAPKLGLSPGLLSKPFTEHDAKGCCTTGGLR